MSATRRHSPWKPRKLGEHDVYLCETGVTLTGEDLERLANRLDAPRPIWPPELLHTAIKRLAWEVI